MLLDYSRQRATLETMEKLFKLAEVGTYVTCPSCGEILVEDFCFLINVDFVTMQAAGLKEKINRMFSGEHVCSNSCSFFYHGQVLCRKIWSEILYGY